MLVRPVASTKNSSMENISMSGLKLLQGGLNGVEEIALHLFALQTYFRGRRGLLYGIALCRQAGEEDDARSAYLNETRVHLAQLKARLEMPQEAVVADEDKPSG